MACAAVLIPCHNHYAEALPIDVPVEEVLDGPVLCAKLSKCRQLHWCATSSTEQVNELATVVAGFMVHGDALITEALQQTSCEDLLSEVQGSLDQLSAFSPSSKSSSKKLAVEKHAVPWSPTSAPSARKAEKSTPSSTATDSLLLSAVRHRRQTAAHSPQSSVEWATDKAADITLDAMPQLFQAPDLPGMQQAASDEAQPVSNDHSVPVQMWAGMQPELLSHVLQQVRWTSREAVALTGVCRSWRQALAEDQPFLKHIMVTIDARAPLRGSQLLCECCRGMSVIVQQARHRQTPIPRVIHRAAHSSNMSASVCLAQVDDARGDTRAALKYWAKAAKLGHPEAQFRLGRNDDYDGSELLQACYEGVGVAADAQDALLWLGRATRTLLAEDLSTDAISNVSTASLLARRNRMHHERQQGVLQHSSARFCTTCSMPEEQVLAKSALLLGFLHLDGEATKFDAGEALKWFKIALLNNCAEAERIIGTLFNTGVPSSMRVLVPSELCTLVSLLIAPLIERLFKKS